MNVYISETKDGKFNIVRVTPTLIETPHNYTLENKDTILASFDFFEDACQYARDYYNKEIT